MRDLSKVLVDVLDFYSEIGHFFVNIETSFSMVMFKLLTFGFHETKIGGEPRGRDGERTDLVLTEQGN